MTRAVIAFLYLDGLVAFAFGVASWIMAPESHGAGFVVLGLVAAGIWTGAEVIRRDESSDR